jgi:hypothetical protein
LKNPMALMRIEPATFKFIAHCLNQLRHHLHSNRNIRNKMNKICNTFQKQRLCSKKIQIECLQLDRKQLVRINKNFSETLLFRIYRNDLAFCNINSKWVSSQLRKQGYRPRAAWSFAELTSMLFL